MDYRGCLNKAVLSPMFDVVYAVIRKMYPFTEDQSFEKKQGDSSVVLWGD